MARKKALVIEGAPMWIVLFADLMSLLVVFFVLLISFSIQDDKKLQVVAGSMRDAFGIRKEINKAGMIEREGSPARDYVKNISVIDSKNDTDFSSIRNNRKSKQGSEANTYEIKENNVETPRQFALAAASLRQAWQTMPDIAEIAESLILEETPEGLNIQLLDQEGRSMFPTGSAEPYDRTRRLLTKIAPVLKAMPNRVRITGHSDSTKNYRTDNYGLWELTADRANAARRILTEGGMTDDQFFAIVGKADSEPLFPEDTFLAANRRISILIMNEAPPMLPTQKP